METITVQMTCLEAPPFNFPVPIDVNPVVAPLASAKYVGTDNSKVLLRVVQFTNEDLASNPSLEIMLDPDNQSANVNFETSASSLNEKPNKVWYGEVLISEFKFVKSVESVANTSNQIPVTAIDKGRPPKTSRGTVIIIMPNETSS